ncbi:twin-arginine translocase subunit TatC [Halococcoides cellulosivorans]|uniref:Sec-independent protein translocase protein TatC n=1 Tax=Halococcoides cellulosivorans TaxID=1679096 RepID=A0A2R4X323_9EURY|nr:twin-arginine translocase subunit TatC [Halococcoides cellulosivorans]AWB28200.1 translocase [Halococcoides cellulosivorans]
MGGARTGGFDDGPGGIRRDWRAVEDHEPRRPLDRRTRGAVGDSASVGGAFSPPDRPGAGARRREGPDRPYRPDPRPRRDPAAGPTGEPQPPSDLAAPPQRSPAARGLRSGEHARPGAAVAWVGPSPRVAAAAPFAGGHGPDGDLVTGRLGPDYEAPDESPTRDSTEGDTTTPDTPTGSTQTTRGGRGDTDPPAETGAPDDQEMPLGAHIEEMVRRLGIVVLITGAVAAVAFPFGEYVINFLWFSYLPGTAAECPSTAQELACPRVYHPLSLMFARLKVATLGGFVVALPAAVYQIYRFMRPGLYPRERRYYLASVPTSLALAVAGLLFAHVLILPILFTYFHFYTQGAAEIWFSLGRTFDLIVMMLGLFALAFQIPLLIVLAVMMNVTSRRWLANKRMYFWGAFLAVSFIFGADPTGMGPFLVAGTMVGLFEGTLLLLRWSGKGTIWPTPEALTRRRPLAWLAGAIAGYVASPAPLPTGYYAAVPTFVKNYLANYDLEPVTPLIVALVIVAIFEYIAYTIRQYRAGAGYRGGSRKPRADQFDWVLRRARFSVWALALLAGYLSSPDPVFLDTFQSVTLPPLRALALGIGIGVAYEILLRGYRFWWERR